jgi:MYXO-CTERM domain-containing protein
MSTRVLAFAAGLAALLASRASSAADWYVDASAASGGTGSLALPFQTINAALAGLHRGDTVWIATGTYDEVVNVTKLSGTGTTTFRAKPGATPVIDGTSGSAAAGFVVQTDVPNVTFQDLTIQNAVNGALGIQFYYADGGQVIHCVTKNMSANAVTFYYSNQGTVRSSTCQGNIAGRKTTGTVVEDNEVFGASAEGVALYDGSTNCTVAHNVIHDNFSVNLYLDSISHSVFDGNLVYETDPSNDLEGIEISDEGHYSDLPAPVNSYNTIINNVIVGHNLGIVFWYSGEWPTKALNDQSGLRYDVISNNTLVNNKGSFKWDASPAHVGTTIENNIAFSAMGTSPINLLQANGAGGITLDHNLWFAPDLPQAFLWLGNQVDHAGWVSASGQGAGDVLGDALFVGPVSVPPATNLGVVKGSPAVGAGVTLAAVNHDFLDAPRPASGTDIGAFQFGAQPPPDGGVVGPPDAGVGAAVSSSSGGGPPGGTGGESAGTGGSGGHASPGKASGCGCRVSDLPTGRAWLVALAALVAFARARRTVASIRRGRG